MTSLEEIAANAAERTGKTKEEILELAKKKKEDLPGISDVGLIQLVSKDLGADSLRPKTQELKIGNIVPNMYNITFVGKIIEQTPVKEFTHKGLPGKVQNLFIADETGSVRMSIWNDEIDKYGLRKGDVVRIENSWIRKDNFNNPEVRIGKAGILKKVDEKIDVKVKEPKTSLKDVEENDNVIVSASVLHVFERPLVYYFCPQCRTKLNGTSCITHGEVEPNKLLIVSCLVDDGNNAMNAVLFRNVAESLLGKNVDEVEKEINEKPISDFLSSLRLMEKKFRLRGIITRNQMTNELEIRVRSVSQL